MEALNFDDSTTAKDFLEKVVAAKINKKPQDLAKFVTILEENWLDNVGALK